MKKRDLEQILEQVREHLRYAAFEISTVCGVNIKHENALIT